MWALLLLEQQIVGPCGYSDAFCGALGAALLGVGALAAFAFSPIMERTKAYAPLQKGAMAANAAAAAALFASNRPGRPARLLVAWAFLGAVLEPLLPLTLEHAAELSYPVPADASTAVLIVRARL